MSDQPETDASRNEEARRKAQEALEQLRLLGRASIASAADPGPAPTRHPTRRGRHIDAVRESRQGVAVLTAHAPYLELAAETYGVVLEHDGSLERHEATSDRAAAVWESETLPVPRLKARLRCPRQHVVGYVVPTTGSADAVLYVKLTESIQDLRDQAAEILGPDAPFDARGSLEPRPVTRRLDTDGDGPPAWCATCRRHHLVDFPRVVSRIAGGDLDVTLTATSL